MAADLCVGDPTAARFDSAHRSPWAFQEFGGTEKWFRVNGLLWGQPVENAGKSDVFCSGALKAPDNSGSFEEMSLEWPGDSRRKASDVLADTACDGSI
jgi:hypothetical protein